MCEHRTSSSGNIEKNGKKVVVKVQNPDAERTFRGDVFALKSIIDIFLTFPYTKTL